MDHFWVLLTDGNIFLLALLAGILFQVGSVVARNSPESHLWGARAAMGMFGLFVLNYLTSHPQPAVEELLAITIRGLIAAWMTAAISLIVLPSVFGLLAMWKTFTRRLQSDAESSRLKRERSRAERQAEIERKARDREWERSAPEREQAHRIAQEKAELERQQKQLAAKRREDVRAKLDLLYSLYAPDINSRYTKPMFDGFVSKYMGDDRSPDEVEERGRQLQTILEQHRDAQKPVKKPRTMQDLTEWFVAEKQRLECLPLDDMLKDEFRAILNERYAELTQRMFQKMEP